MVLEDSSAVKAVSKHPIQVLLTVGNSRSGLAVARSLAMRDLSFLVVGADPHSLAFRSRFAKDVLLSPSPSKEPEAFFQFILDVIRRYHIELVMPVTDVTMFLFDRFRKELGPHTKLAMPSSEALRSVLDKRTNLKIAQQLGIPCPRTFELNSPEQIPEMIEALGFPIVLKPPAPPGIPNVPGFQFKVLFAHNEEQLRGYIDQHCRDGVYPLFQECAVGQVHNLCCFAARGEVIAIHEYHSIRRLRGEGVLRKIAEPIPEAEQCARQILGALEWDGVAHVGFFVRRNRRESKLWYMEINGRFWASLEGSVHAGWDFPYWTYNYFLHGKKPEAGPIKIGSRTCWHRGDLEALLHYYLGDEVPATGTNPGKFLATLQYLSGFSPAIHSDVFRWSDPLPEIIDHWQLFRNLWSRLRNRIIRRMIEGEASRGAVSNIGESPREKMRGGARVSVVNPDSGG